MFLSAVTRSLYTFVFASDLHVATPPRLEGGIKAIWPTHSDLLRCPEVSTCTQRKHVHVLWADRTVSVHSEAHCFLFFSFFQSCSGKKRMLLLLVWIILCLGCDSDIQFFSIGLGRVLVFVFWFNTEGLQVSPLGVNQHKNGYSSVSFTAIDLQFCVVVAKSHSYHLLWALTDG